MPNLVKMMSRAAALAIAVSVPTFAAAERVVVTHSTKSFAFLTYFAAHSMGYFEEMGLDIEEVRTGTGSKSLAAVVGGNADVYLGSTASVFTARKQGVPVQIFAPVVAQLSSSVVVSAQWAERHGITDDSTLEEKLEALRGARIAVSGAGSGSDQALRYVALEAELNPDRDMTVVMMGNNASTYFSAMQQGQIDGFCTSPPDTHVPIKDFGAKMLLNTAAGELPALDGYFYIGAIARENWLDQNPETATQFNRAMQMAMDAIHDSELSPQVGEAVYNMYYDDMDRELFDIVWEDQRQSVPATVEMTDEMLERVVSFTNTFSEEQVDPGMISEVYTNAFAVSSAPISN